MKIRFLFKTKGGHKKGMGDVMSSLALAEELRKRRHDVSFLINNNRNVADLVSANRFGCAVKKDLGGVDVAVLNQLNTPLNEAKELKRFAHMLVTIEDTGVTAERLADMRFNVLYPIKNAYTDFKFIPIGPIFQKRRRILKRIRRPVRRILVTQGGSDTYGFTPKIVRGLYKIPKEIRIDVILGPNFSHTGQLEKALAAAPRDFMVIKGLADLSGLMQEADIAVSAGGNTLFELACLGIPTAVVCGEPFEAITAKRMEKKGFGVNLGFGKFVSEEKIYKATAGLINNFALRKRMSAAGRGLVDGHGIKRMSDAIIRTFSGRYHGK